MPQVLPSERQTASTRSPPQAHGSATSWIAEGMSALQAALQANRAHHRRVEGLGSALDDQERALSDSVRQRMGTLREAVNARERELLAEVQAAHSMRQGAVDEAQRACEHSWRALTQLQDQASARGQLGQDDDFQQSFHAQLAQLSHVPELPNADLALYLSVEAVLASVEQLAFALGDDALHLAWREKSSPGAGTVQTDLRVKELAAQLQMVSADNARREEDVLAANKRIRHMEEEAAAHAAEELRLQIVVERHERHVRELQQALDAVVAEAKQRELQHRQDIVEMQELSTEKESLLMTLMQEAEEDRRSVMGKLDDGQRVYTYIYI